MAATRLESLLRLHQITLALSTGVQHRTGPHGEETYIEGPTGATGCTGAAGVVGPYSVNHKNPSDECDICIRHREHTHTVCEVCQETQEHLRNVTHKPARRLRITCVDVPDSTVLEEIQTALQELDGSMKITKHYPSTIRGEIKPEFQEQVNALEAEHAVALEAHTIKQLAFNALLDQIEELGGYTDDCYLPAPRLVIPQDWYTYTYQNVLNVYYLPGSELDTLLNPFQL